MNLLKLEEIKSLEKELSLKLLLVKQKLEEDHSTTKEISSIEVLVEKLINNNKNLTKRMNVARKAFSGID
ncbi:MAG: hypothetical protein HeimC3_30130 [Candidatus Heimdallarchaeota archaeon LC_3]|nr:MAG: hypothetical protein HeimC3_30130 [Candidatus Heimdallarchaeota archaeon LC_3]